MSQRSKVTSVVLLLVVWCLSVLTSISRAAISAEELRKIEDAVPSKSTAAPKAPRKLLVFNRCEGFKHSAIPYGAKALEIMGRKTGAYEAVMSDDMSLFKPENLKQFDAICLNNTTRLKFDDPALRKSLMDFVRNGKGIVGIHAATDNFYDWPEGAEMMGGLFDGHPWRSNGTWAVQIDDPQHPLTAAFKGEGFKINEEIYRTKAPYSRDKLRVLVSLDMTDKTNLGVKDLKLTDKDIPISWLRSYGKGRVFYCSLGHNHHIFWNPAILQHYLDGIQFAMGDLKADATPSIEKALGAVAGYKYGQSRRPLTEIVEFIGTLHKSPEKVKEFEERLVKLLRSDTTPDGKQFICRQLSLIGTEYSVPTLEAMLTEKATSKIEPSDMARYALERIPSPAADMALRNALGKTRDKVKVGIINSLGQRRDATSVRALRRLIYDRDKEVAGAAVAALGKIAGPKATRALAKARNKTAGSLRLMVLDAYLQCADELRNQGNNSEALAIYNQMYKRGEPEVIRIAALRGILIASEDKAGDIIIDVLKGTDQAMQSVAIGLLKEISAAKIIEAVTAEMPNLSVNGQVQVLSALADSKDAAALPAVIRATKAENESIRSAAFRALGTLGGPANVELLASVAASKDNMSKTASESLDRLSAEGVDAAILKYARKGDAKVRVVLIRSLATRQHVNAVPTLLESAEDQNSSIRKESLKALGALAYEEALPAMVNLLLKAQTSAERSAAEKAVLATCKRAKDADRRTQILLDALPGASVAARASLLRLLGQFGGQKPLEVLRAAVRDDNEDIQYAAIRTLANDWPGTEPAAMLIELAQSSPKETHRVLALRGYIRMVGLTKEISADERLKMYKAAMSAASRPDEKKLILADIPSVKTVETLNLVEPYLLDEAVKNEAKVAYMALALALKEKHPKQADAAIARIEQISKTKSAVVSAGRETIISPTEGIITPPLKIIYGEDGTAYMVVPTKGASLKQGQKGGRAVFSFSTAKKGTLALEFHINCPSNEDDSWYIKLDENRYINWNDTVTKGWQWRKFPEEYSVAKGKHILVIDQREDGAMMGKIKLTLK